MAEKHLDQVLDSIPAGRFHYRLLLVCGMCFCADSMEVALLSFISICAGTEWNLNHHQIAWIASAVFIGTLVGNLFFGPFADRYGRRGTFIISCFIMITAGALSAFSPNFIILVLLRTLCGIGIGGVVIPFDLLAEFVPNSERGHLLSFIGYFWTLGSVFVSGLAWGLLPGGNWHTLTLVTAIPVTISLVLGIYILPESPRWLYVMGKSPEAVEIIKEAAAYNKTPIEDFTLTSPSLPSQLQRSPLAILLSSRSRLVSLSVWAMWFFYGFTYYAVILFTMKIFDRTKSGSESAPSACSFEYSEIFIGSISEVLGVILCTIVIGRFGRLPILRLSYFISAVCAVILTVGLNDFPRIVIGGISYLLRCSTLCGVSAIWLTTPEFFPTSTRVTGHAIASSVSRIGSFIAPFVVQLSGSTRMIAFIIFSTSAMTVCCTIFLPETSGKSLEDCEILTSPPTVLNAKIRSRKVLNLLQRHRYEYLGEDISSAT